MKETSIIHYCNLKIRLLNLLVYLFIARYGNLREYYIVTTSQHLLRQTYSLK